MMPDGQGGGRKAEAKMEGKIEGVGTACVANNGLHRRNCGTVPTFGGAAPDAKRLRLNAVRRAVYACMRRGALAVAP